MSLRLNKLLRNITKQGLDGFLVTNPINVSYLTGFKPSESYLLISRDKKFFITDFRYEQEAKVFLKKNWTLIILNGSIFKTVAKLSKTLGIEELGFEAKSLPFAEYIQFKKELAPHKFEPTHDVVSLIRMIKDQNEVSLMKKAIGITFKGFDFIKDTLRPGIKERELAVRLEHFLKQQGADAVSFPIIVVSGAHSSLPHASVSNRRIQKNDLVLVDMGVSYKGYKSDLTRVFFLGKISSRFRQIYDVVLEAQRKAIKSIKPGIKISKIDKLSRDYISQKGWANNFRHSLGHGIGLEVHEEPAVTFKNDAVLKAGMVFTVEPAVYISDKFGIRLEEMILVTKKGCEVLSGSWNNPA